MTCTVQNESADGQEKWIHYYQLKLCTIVVPPDKHCALSKSSAMAGLVHLVPYSLDDNATDHYSEDHKSLIDLLQLSFDGLFLDIYEPKIHSPYPIGITLNYFYKMREVSRVVSKAIQAIVTNYFSDLRLCDSLLSLSADAQSLLALMQGRPYCIGSWRPDLLFPKGAHDDFLICEINARYAFNGYFCSYEKNKILNKLPYLNGLPIMPVTELQDIPNLFQGFFDESKVIGILKTDPTEGWDVKMFHSSVASPEMKVSDPLLPVPRASRDDSSSFPSLPINIRVASNELSKFDIQTAENSSSVSQEHKPTNGHMPRDEGTTYGGVRFVTPMQAKSRHLGIGVFDDIGLIEQFAIECSQSELLAMDRNTLVNIIRCPHINDIRTILIAHDKRMLSVLTTPDIMQNYLSPVEVNILMSNIVDTYICGVHKDVVLIAKHERENWLMKPNGGGKGIGIVFGRDCRCDEDWWFILDDPAHSCYVLQRVVSQQVVEIQQNKGLEEMLVVGIMHCFNDKFLGPGIFRASSPTQPIVNVSGGNGIILSPAVLSSRWKLTRNPHTSFDYDNCSCPTSGLKNLLFDMPEDCIFQVEKLQNAPNSVIKYETATLDRIWSTLNKEGIVLVKCHWRQNSTLRALPECSTSESHETKMFSSEINAEMIDFISQMGGIPHSHTLEGPEEQVWDVKPYFKAARTKTCDNVDLTPPPRSHTSDEFGMHTDCSFEDPPPRFVALYVVQEDTFGGGYTTLIDTDALNRYLSRKSLLVFKNRDFTVTVPPEFFKGVKHITLKLITAKEKLWSYRSDIVRRDLCDEEQRNALDELDGLLSNPSLILTTMLPTGAMLLLDNMRWFHGRSSIMDSRRWLKRVRFQPSPSRIPPALNRLVSRSDSCPADDKIV